MASADTELIATPIGYEVRMPTRWHDNDAYGHINNTVYYAFMDTAINTWLIEVGGLSVPDGDLIGVCAASSCEYLESAAFPEPLVVGLGVLRLGRTSVTWATRIATEAEGRVLARGRFTHVFVDAAQRRPMPLPPLLRERLTRLGSG